MAEQKSHHILVGRLPPKHAEGVTERTRQLYPPHQHKCHTVTFEKGKEIAGHKTIAS
ncbi:MULTISPECIES: hypothetical protein [Nitrosomonas]|nr:MULTISPECIES: hypothetical protein [Nitrosomonas]UVS62759.1 hypothetical protein NX761_06520 [Nitrosomonas sp. PLL12]